MRVTEKMTSDNAIYNINKSQNRLNQLNELLSSNQNINRPSDDPIGTRQILDMQSQVRSIDQYMSNIQNGQTWTSVANIALQGMNDFLTQAKSAASNILGGMNDPVSVLNALSTLENVRQQMIDLANVQVGDQYLFGGYNNATPVVSNKNLSGVVDVSKLPNQIAFNDTSGLIVGMTVSGKGILPETTITAIDTINKVVTISENPISTGSGFDYTFGMPATTQKGNTSIPSSQITGIDATDFFNGMAVSGPGVPSGTTILNVDSASQITLSQPLTQAVTGGTFTFLPNTSKTGGSTTALTNTITGLPDTTGLAVGMSVSGPNIPTNTKITGIAGTTLTLNNNATLTAAGGTFTFGPTVTKAGTSNPPNQITGLPLAQLQNLYIGMKVTGPGIPDNTTITDLDTTDNKGTGSITLSNIPTGPGGAGKFIFEGYIDSYSDRSMIGTVTTGSSTISGLPSTTNMINAPTVSKTGSTNPSVNPNQITGLLDTNGLTVGMPITDNAGGTIIAPNTIITEIDPMDKSITLSNALIPPTKKAGGIGMTTSVNITAAGTLAPGTLNIVAADGTSYAAKIAGPETVPGAQDAFGAADVGLDLTINVNGVITKIGTYSTDAFGKISALNYTNPVSVGIGGGVTQPITFTYTAAIIGAATSATAGTLASTAATIPPNQITGIADTTNLFEGMPVSGPGIPANTIITGTPTSIHRSAPGTVALSNTPTVTAAAGSFNFSTTPTTLKTTTAVSFNFSPPIAKTGATISAMSKITGLPDTNNLFVGMSVTDNTGGTVIPANTTITAIDSLAKTITLSNAPALTTTGTKFFFAPTMPKTGSTVAAVNQITGIVDTTNLFVGMPVTGPGIPANTTITATPTSVPASTANTITLSNNPTLTAAYGTFYFGQYSAMTVAGTGVTPNPSIGAIVNRNSLNLSTAATTVTSTVGGTALTFSGHFAAEDIKVNINKSSQVALNYSVSKLLLGGAPPATTQASGPPPSTLPVNILGTIGELITAIQNKDDAGVIAAASNLKTATDQVNLAQTEYAGRTIRLDSAKTMLTNNQNTLKNIISSKQTLDTAKTIIQLQQQTTAYQAALQGTAKILPMSLMDYLK
jgi:flagellin-like hook-associated protein FlgL